MHTRYTFLKAALVAGFITPPILDDELALVRFGAQAQTQPPPQVEWISPYTHEDERSESGVYYDFNWGGPATGWLATPAAVQNLGGAQSREESGEDWHFGHENYMVGSEVAGLITGGYSSWPNLYWKGTGCTRTIAQEVTQGLTATEIRYNFTPRPAELEKPNNRKGETRCMVARLDLNGNPIWYRGLLPGQIFNVTQDSDGNILAAGVCYSNVWPNDMRPTDNPVIRWNSDATFDYTQLDCTTIDPDPLKQFVGRVGFVVKLDPEGNVLWCTVLTSNTGSQAYPTGSSMFDVVVRPGTNGPEYWVVGLSTGTGDGTQQNCIYRISQNGSLLEQVRYKNGDSGTPAGWPMTNFGYFSSLAYNAVDDKLFATGVVEITNGKAQAIGVLVDPDNIDVGPDWFLTTETGPLVGVELHNPNKVNYTSGGGFVNASSTRIVWPVLGNYDPDRYTSGPKEATLFVHGLDLSGALLWTADLGLVHAYDLQSDMVATVDGKVAIVSTKWRDDPDDFDEEFTYNELPASAQACLANEFNYVVEGNTANQEDWPTSDKFLYWNTDAFVAKLDPTNGDMLWCTQWDADPDNNFECSPGDLRNQECMYKISELPDGGLVLSGNTSHNFDDYYLTKLYTDCQSKALYDIQITGDLVDGVYTVGTNETWDTDKDIYGTIVVPLDHTLTISSATIRFADSEQLAIPTRVIVEPGGRLILSDATLTAIETCPNSMWDGIEVHGDEFAQQGPASGTDDQGFLGVYATTISNARVGALAANELALGPVVENTPGIRSGGIIQAKDATFYNNLYDVSFSPYENHILDPQTQQPVVANNRSYFIRTRFTTEGALAKPELVPRTHATLALVRGIVFSGCTYSNDLGAYQDYEFYADQGRGIHSISSSFRVQGHCNTILSVGETCPDEDFIASRFIGLHRGIQASTMDLSRTFSVSRSVFDNVNLGIRMDGIHDASITQSTFIVPSPKAGDEVSTMYGMYSEQCTGYTIEENSFATVLPGLDRRRVGLIIRNSLPEHNVFYNNRFDGLLMGSTIMGHNATEPPHEEGLEVRCNDYGVVEKNAYDVALTGTDVTVQAKQGGPVEPGNDETRDNPAGNRFSPHTGADDPESDWHVSTGSNFVDYFYHPSNTGERTKPIYSNTFEIGATDAGANWPGKPIACPSNFGRSRHELRQASGLAHEAWEDAASAYDAAKDNGDTYSLMGYVNNAANSSTQVRNALQSVAPKVSVDVWQAAFERIPTMQPMHITQALLSNSPLQGEVVKMVDTYALPTYYADLVYNGQSGDASLLAILQSEVAHYAGEKAEALAELGNASWLDSLDLSGSLDSLMLWHETLHSDKSASTIVGVLSAKRELAALQLLAQAEELSSSTPEVYAVVKRYAAAEQEGGWDGSAADLAYIDNLAAQRETIGSALAYGWREALGEELPEEIIFFPEETPKLALTEGGNTVEWPSSSQLEAFPNPSTGPVFLTYQVPEETDQGELRVVDLSGRDLFTKMLGNGPGALVLQTDAWEPGIYLAELRVDGAPVEQTRFVVVR